MRKLWGQSVSCQESKRSISPLATNKLVLARLLRMSKCCVNPEWQQNKIKCEWVKPIPGNKREVQCCLCRKIFQARIGLMALDSLMKSTRATARQQQAPIAQLCAQQRSSPTATCKTSTVATASSTEEIGCEPVSSLCLYTNS